ncbi:hypothetical protein AKG12_01750 [Agrobacterium sp. SUL3]|nr:hypothetical protein AKG12_01750 [Agrobacterium sp. SUL3]
MLLNISCLRSANLWTTLQGTPERAGFHISPARWTKSQTAQAYAPKARCNQAIFFLDSIAGEAFLDIHIQKYCLILTINLLF